MFGYFDTMLRYFEFSGRSSRTQYWMFQLTMLVILVAAVSFDIVLAKQTFDGEHFGGFLTLFVCFIHIVPGITVTVRRLHDSGHSGWWYWISLVPFIGGIWLLVLMFFGPSDDADQYGEDPRNGTPMAPSRGRAIKASQAQMFVAQMEARKRERRVFNP